MLIGIFKKCGLIECGLILALNDHSNTLLMLNWKLISITMENDSRNDFKVICRNAIAFNQILFQIAITVP